MWIQFVIFASSVTAVFLLTSKPSLARWGSLVGLVGQPFWIYVTWRAQAWGIVAVSLWFAICYGRGVWRGFLSSTRSSNV